MLFNSLSFLIFFPIVASLTYVVPFRARWAFLLVASAIFYAWFIPAYLLILVGMILLDYAAGLCIDRSAGAARRRWLLVSLAANISLLAAFKYWNFAMANMTAIGGWFGLALDPPLMRMLLPIGLSFHTFQAMSYTIEVYRGHQPPERHLGYFALYVLFFPQLVAGPIERPQHLLPQLHQDLRFDYARVTSGLRLMLGGLLMKVLVADRLAVLVNPVYAEPHLFSGPMLALATAFFAFQIFCDFAGYSYIAIGAARVLGIDLTTNFRNPFLASTISEYWQRWHISLTTWFRDYVYTPLVGQSLSLTRARAAIVATFLLSGIWHGANWTFVAWGGLHGVYLVIGHLTWRSRRRLHRALGLGDNSLVLTLVRPMIVFGLVCLSFVFFRAHTMADALYIVTHLGTGWGSIADFRWQLAIAQAHLRFLAVAAVAIACALAASVLSERGKLTAAFAAPWWVRWSCYYAAIVLVWRLGSFGERPFLYFQF
jgi:D-alanyl-lipoteichoic acid acyltransferase DltB (MBOAT superfamily)